ncbi:MAG: GTP-sensing pleiotropic transcriptional regulator CodY [Bacillota bacterium]|jgi:transcriptional pleiotropic repressor
MKNLLEKTRDINKIIQKAAGHPISFVEMAERLCKNINTNVYIVGRKGKVLGYAFIDNFFCPTMDDVVKLDAHFPDKNNDDLLRVTEPKVNMDADGFCMFGVHSKCFIENKYSTIIPIVGGGQRLGTLILSKTGEIDCGDLILAEYGATVIGMEILRAKVEKVEDVSRQKAVVSIAFDTLSYSELEAVEHIFRELGSTNGLLVASKIADKVGITRSVIVNALRKLESAGVIEVRSLGMKGTYIRILNKYLLEELDRIRTSHGRI